MYVKDRVADGGDLRANQLSPHHRFMVAVENHVAAQVEHGLRGRGARQRVAVAVPADGHQVGKVAEGAAEHVAGQTGPVLR